MCTQRFYRLEQVCDMLAFERHDRATKQSAEDCMDMGEESEKYRRNICAIYKRCN